MTVSPQNPCQKRIGFLFRRVCGRTSTVGCPHCQEVGDDPFFTSSSTELYPNYGRNSPDSTNIDNAEPDPINEPDVSCIDFTEADAESLCQADTDFEMDMGAS